MSESRVRENRTHGSMRRREGPGDQSASPCGNLNLPPTLVGSQGSVYGRFQKALATGNVAIIDAAARELPTLSLRDALRIVVVMARNSDARYARAAARWSARATAEQGLDVDDARRVLALLEILPRAPEAVSEE